MPPVGLKFHTAALLFFKAQHPQSDLVSRILVVSRSHTLRHTHSARLSERVISSSQGPLGTRHRRNTIDEHPCLQRQSNLLSQESSGLITYSMEQSPS